MLHGKSSAIKEVLGLESKKVSQLERVNQALPATVGMGNVVNELMIVDLIEPVAGNRLVPPGDASAVWHLEFRFFGEFLTNWPIDKKIERWIENVEDQHAFMI